MRLGIARGLHFVSHSETTGRDRKVIYVVAKLHSAILCDDTNPNGSSSWSHFSGLCSLGFHRVISVRPTRRKLE